MSDQARMYDAPVSAVEQDRLATFSYPNEVSKKLLGGLDFSSLIDAGAGPGTSLAEYVIGRGAAYTAFDFKPEMVAQLENALSAKQLSARVMHANILDIPDGVGRADVVHERFVFMHLPKDAHQKALDGLMRIANKNVLLLEWNWHTMSSIRHQRELDRFKEASFETMKHLHVDPYAGETLEDFLLDGSCGRETWFKADLRPEGNYTSDLVDLCSMQRDLARRMDKEDLAKEFDSLHMRFSRSPISFTPAEIVIAVVKV